MQDRRLKFMDLACEYEANCKFRGLKGEKWKKGLVYQGTNDLFEKFYKDTCKLFKA